MPTAKTASPAEPDNDELRRRAQRLGLYGLLADWDVVKSEPWVPQVLDIEERERGRRSLERRLRSAKLGRFKPDEVKHLFVDEVLFCYHDKAVPHAEQPADVKMLARLRHNAFVRRDDQQNKIDTARTGEHVLYESFMAGHIDKADAVLAKVKLCKTEVDGYPAFFFFRKAVGIGTGQGPASGYGVAFTDQIIHLDPQIGKDSPDHGDVPPLALRTRR